MPSFLNGEQIARLTGTFQNHFETFSSGINNFVTLYKEPIQVISNPNDVNVYGYNNQDVNSNASITYQEVSKTFPAMILHGKDIKSQPAINLAAGFTLSDLFIKVDEENKDFIMNGKNERALINGLVYDINPDYTTQNYFGVKFYYFKCDERQ